MTNKKLSRRDDGFTIIEVLIVLAIAGLIMLIVFLAVPKLQQNARNTQRTQDAANLLASIGDFVNDNNGNLPGTGNVAVASDKTTTIPIVTGSGDSPLTGAKMGFYKNGNIDIGTAMPTTGLDGDHLHIVLGFPCTGNALSATASSRAYAAIYYIEPGNVQQCKD